ncbi:phosphotransferase enzyme family protein [Daejeonella lutea]|uniref:Phosphotransferase enzyme family protein n=1 Tax=Daejeonella lutea TaxID=572036 RepID=A0A1T5F5P2_9SPHI|nr:phosphotransferase [Daejeonella lutea]SKB91494.1 Phosphotransferase enzyme family protein [Daejeonella lutea]
MSSTVEKVAEKYGYSPDQIQSQKFGTGHINSTYLLSVDGEDKKFILQSINQNVFKDPLIIAQNVRLVGEYLKKNYPEYLFVGSIPALSGEEMPLVDGVYWRMSRFIPNSVAYDTLSDPKQAFEAAEQFGRLSKLLSRFDPSLLRPSIPGFHDLNLRYDQFKEAHANAEEGLKLKASHQIETALSHSFIVDFFNSYKNSPDFPDRAMHHDTKISNMLFDKTTNEGLCVIDLDTLMAGKFISDLGDMMRTYVCAFSENEADMDKIFIRVEYFEAIINGYLKEMGSILTNTEKDLILFSGKYLIYMQALRFLTDYLNGNVYYPISYPEQNLVRTVNQFKLLSEFFSKEKILQSIVDKCLHS